MNNRTNDLLKIRLGVKTTTLNNNMSAGEYFQNATLRPSIQFQKELLIESFKNYVKKHKNVFYSLSTDKKLHYIENAIQRDIKFRNSLKGMIIGVFSLEEYKQYIQDSSALNKRMMNLVIERLKDNILLLEYPEDLSKAG
ncbi:MAG: glyoxalase [Flavobacteriaceae bacterium]|nr:glyoxalase [Flavobacteriaceae bacterium]